MAFGEHVPSDDDIPEACPVGLEGAVWRKSSWSAYNGNCVEVARLPQGMIAVRDSKDASCGRVLAFEAAAWRSFVASVKRRSKP